MMTRRDFVALAAAFGAASVEGYAAGRGQANSKASAGGCGEKMAVPAWKHLSSASGELPVPETSDQQTGSMVVTPSFTP